MADKLNIDETKGEDINLSENETGGNGDIETKISSADGAGVKNDDTLILDDVNFEIPDANEENVVGTINTAALGNGLNEDAEQADFADLGLLENQLRDTGNQDEQDLPPPPSPDQSEPLVIPPAPPTAPPQSPGAKGQPQGVQNQPEKEKNNQVTPEPEGNVQPPESEEPALPEQPITPEQSKNPETETGNDRKPEDTKKPDDSDKLPEDSEIPAERPAQTNLNDESPPTQNTETPPTATTGQTQTPTPTSQPDDQANPPAPTTDGKKPEITPPETDTKKAEPSIPPPDAENVKKNGEPKPAGSESQKNTTPPTVPEKDQKKVAQQKDSRNLSQRMGDKLKNGAQSVKNAPKNLLNNTKKKVTDIPQNIKKSFESRRAKTRKLRNQRRLLEQSLKRLNNRLGDIKGGNAMRILRFWFPKLYASLTGITSGLANAKDEARLKMIQSKLLTLRTAKTGLGSVKIIAALIQSIEEYIEAISVTLPTIILPILLILLAPIGILIFFILIYINNAGPIVKAINLIETEVNKIIKDLEKIMKPERAKIKVRSKIQEINERIANNDLEDRKKPKPEEKPAEPANTTPPATTNTATA